MLAPLACRTASRRLLSYRGAGSFLRPATTRMLSSYPPHEVMGLPSLSPTMESGSIAAWNLKVGDTFSAGDVFCSVETDKATVDFEAQDEGVVAKILVDAGPAELKVGAPILVIVEDADDVSAFADFEASGGGAAATPEPAAAAAPVAATPVQAVPVAAAPAASTTTGGSVFASPLARALAKEKSLDISQVPGTGPVGRVLAADVQEFTPSAASALSATAPTAGSSTNLVSPVSSGWESSSKRNIPHYYLSVDINVESVMKLRSELSQSISLYAFLIKAAAKAMEAVPAVNAAYTDAFVRQYSNVDMNIEGGAGGVLTISNCASLGLSAIETALTDEPTAAATPGTFTLLNLGVYGITSCAPIIREPQACALAVGAVRDLATGPVLSATLSCDHRVVDGAVGAQWLAAFRNHIENPSTLLL